MPKDQGSEAGTRLLSSWISGFLQYTDSLQSPESFRLWAGLGALAGAVERKVWLRSQGRPLSPNLYIFLVGPPASGKTNALREARTLFASLETHHIAETNLTKAALMDTLNDAKRTIFFPKEETYNSVFIACEELGALLPGYDADFLNALTTIYDGSPYLERRRHRSTDDQINIQRPNISIVACTTPGYLVETLPPAAWDQGFLSRVIIVFDDFPSVKPFNLSDDGEGPTRDHDLERALQHDLRVIGNMAGRVLFTREAAEQLDKWHIDEKEEPKPNHPRLINYIGRRGLHVLKLCALAAVDAGRLTVELDDVQTAMNWLVGAEGRMPEVFVTMASGGDARVIDDCWHMVFTYSMRHGNKGIPVHEVVRFLQNRTSAHNVMKIYETMLQSHILKCVNDPSGVVLVTAQAR